MTNEKTIFIFDAKEGMVLSCDIINSDGHLVAAANTKLDIDIISKISGYHILEINVYEEKTQPEVVVDAENASYFDKVRQSDQFKRFYNEYCESVDDLKNQLNDVVIRNTPIDTEALLANTISLIKNNSNKLQLFDMLHSLKRFDDLTFTHSINVALVASIIAQWMHMPEEDVRLITLCGLLHDIGKLMIPSEILTKPDKLTDGEFAMMKQHVNFGYERIKQEPVDNRIKEVCLLHHEKCDGSGYPFGLPSAQIPDFAKIITVADIYDAMTTDRVYRGAVCPFEVIHMMEQESFSKLDPKFSLPFLKNVVSSYIHNTVKLSNGDHGEVILINDRSLSRPVVQCGEKFIDLSKTPDVSITAIL